MNLYKRFSEFPSNEGRIVLTAGNFDGVHMGHRALLEHTVQRARQLAAKAVFVTFDPHPVQLFKPGSFTPLQTLRERVDAMARLEPYAIGVVEFNRDLADTPAREFFTHFLLKKLDLAGVVLGWNSTFGKGREGTAEKISEFGKEMGFEVDIFPAYMWEGKPVSSTRIRNAIADGDCRAAAAMLGHPYVLRGHVVKGFQRGRKLGFPTANLSRQSCIVPANGVYGGYCIVDGQRHLAAISVGTNPTFGNLEQSVEAFILDFDKEIYGETIEIEFAMHVRSGKKFANVDELIAEMTRDVQRIRESLD